MLVLGIRYVMTRTVEKRHLQLFAFVVYMYNPQKKTQRMWQLDTS